MENKGVLHLVKKIRRDYHNKTYVNWSKEGKTDSVRLFKDELIEKIQELKSLGYKQIKHTTIRKKCSPKSFSVTTYDKYVILTYYDGNDYYRYITNYKDDKKNDPETYQIKVFGDFHTRFKKRTNKTLIEAFGSTGQYMKVCVPKNFYYINLDYPKETFINHVGKVDFSSMFPACACGKLPTAKGSKVVEGYVKPNKDYPFAFYPDSGHCAEYGVFDTHEWTNSKYVKHTLLNKEKYQGEIFKEDRKTILMKASKETLDEEMSYQYDIKQSFPKDSKEYKSAKLFLLKIIGMFEQNKKEAYEKKPFAHLAAVIKCRAIKKMLDLINKVGDENVIQIILDGMIYKGKEAHGTKDKYLGACIQEFTDGEFIQLGCNEYIIKDKKSIDGAHAGYDIRTDGEPIDRYDNLLTITKWRKSKKMDYLNYLREIVEVEEIKNEKKEIKDK